MTVFDFVIGTLKDSVSQSLESRILQLCAQIEDNLIILKDDDHKLSIQGSLSTLASLEAKIDFLLSRPGIEHIERNEETIAEEGAAARTISGVEAKHLGILDGRNPRIRSEKPLTLLCDLCSFKTNRPSHLQSHVKKHATADKLVNCDLCTFKCIRFHDLAKHRKSAHASPPSHGKKELKCSLCDFSASSSRSLEIHKVSKHVLPDHVNLFECTKCSYKTVKSALMNRHLSKHAPKQANNQPKNPAKRLHCDQCEYTTFKVGNLTRHKLTHSGVRKYLCITCGLNFKRSDTLKQHLAIHAQGGELVKVDFPSCNICGKICRSQSHLEEHSANHSLARNFLCDLCGSAFKTKAMQLKHLSNIHKKRRGKVKCSKCDVNLSSAQGADRHKKDFHKSSPKTTVEDINDHVDEEDEDEEPVIYTLDLTQDSNDPCIENSLHAYLINESGALILSSSTNTDFTTDVSESTK